VTARQRAKGSEERQYEHGVAGEAMTELFGAFETAGCHFFDTNHPTYLRIAAIARMRNGQDRIGLALRRGRQYLRETPFLRRLFAIPGRGELGAIAILAES
jgi:hypothetical protein